MEHWIDLFRQSLLAVILGLKVNWINYWLDYEVMLCLPVLHILISPSVYSSPTFSNSYRIFRQNEEPGVNTYFVRDVSSQSKEDSWLHLQSGCPGEGVFTQTYISFFLFGVCYRLSLYQLQCYILTVSAQQFWSVAADIIWQFSLWKWQFKILNWSAKIKYWWRLKNYILKRKFIITHEFFSLSL